MACILAVALLACASVAQSQVIEEGEFPVKGGGVSGEAFSLSCPPRLVVQAGSSVVLSCSAAAVPEEGIRYEWESLSTDGLHLLSDAQALSPLFTAPFSGEDSGYAYRLTAMSVGVYETADVTVVVEGFPGDDARGRGEGSAGPEGCDTFAFEGDREGCVSKGEGAELFSPFEGFPGEEGGAGLVPPGSPGAPDQGLPGLSGAGDPAQQTAPYLDCPPAVFLEELEVGSIECHVSDALGEEFLEYMWEPVGSTTRDYLDNPRLIPEDAPNPSVVAPEAPVYETLESFRSGGTTFRYRYRLTVTSRATGLSSFSEVEVFVSSTRPSVYCPLEVAVEEGSTVTLDCKGVDPLSFRMDYDEDGASIEWEWEGLWGTSMSLLDATDLSSPLFTAPVGSAGKEYHYIASMTSSASGESRTARRRVTVTVTGGEEGEQDAADSDALADTGSAPVVTCEDPAPVYEGADDIELDCSVTDEPSDPTYAWTTRGSTSDTDDLTNTDSLRATFSVPGTVNADTDYEYTVTLSAAGIDAVTEDVTVTVKKKRQITVTCAGNPYGADVTERSFRLNCSAQGASAGSSYTYRWTTREDTPNSALDKLGNRNVRNPEFKVPSSIPPGNTPLEKHFYYTLTASAENARPGAFDVTVTEYMIRAVQSLRCDAPGLAEFNEYTYELDVQVDEGDDNFSMECSTYFTYYDEEIPVSVKWTWEPAYGGESRLTKKRGRNTVFRVPKNVPRNMSFRYEVWSRGLKVYDSFMRVNVSVRNKPPPPDLSCEVPDPVYEGENDFTLDCKVKNKPSGAAYLWTARPGTSDTSLLSSETILKPTFTVPDSVDENTEYKYRLTLSAPNIDDVTEDVIVTVLDTPVIEGTMDLGVTRVWEGEPNFRVPSGSYTGAAAGSSYNYRWRARNATATANLRLSNPNIETPYFLVPAEVSEEETYEYTLAVSVNGVGADSLDVSYAVIVQNKPPITVTCEPSAYEVDEGENTETLNCSASGAPPGSTYNYAWTARGGTSGTDELSATDISSPDFEAPDDIDGDKIYKYKLTASADYMEDGSANVMVTVKDRGTPVVTCEDPDPVYEGSPPITLNCSVRDDLEAPVYSWTARDDTPDTALLTSGVNSPTPTFSVPATVPQTTKYRYLLTVSADNADTDTAPVTVTVWNAPRITVLCTLPLPVDEGDEDFALDCEASGAPGDTPLSLDPSYKYSWTARGDTEDTALLTAGTDGPTPTFAVPENVYADTDYEYRLTVSADNAEDGSADVAVMVRDVNMTFPVLACTDPDPAYEGSGDITLSCSVEDEPAGATYSWTGTDIAARLTGTDGLDPTFSVPDEVAATTDYEYAVTLSAPAPGLEGVMAEITVKVLDRPDIAVTCAPVNPLYEGSADFDLDCSASGALAGSKYDYVWTARGDTPDTALLVSGTDGPTPTFSVPDEVDVTTTYEYLLTVSAENAEDGAAEVAVKVLNTGALAVICTNPPSVYEGSADFALDCSASGAPAGSTYDYAWTARDGTANTDLLIAGTDGPTPTFAVPDEVDVTTTYEYLLTVSAENAEDGAAEVAVTVLNRGALAVVCTDPPSVYEGSADFALDCSASGAPAGSAYDYAWTARDGTANTDLLIAGTDGPTPTFAVPGEVDVTTTYEYLLTVSAENAEDGAAEVAVTVLNTGALAVVCTSPDPVYEGSADFALDCSASGAPAGSAYDYAWTARGDTPDTALLVAGTDGPTPTFAVPENVASTTTYEYLLTVSAENAADGAAEVTVTVLNTGAPAVVCTNPYPVYEGSADFALDCSASGAPAGSTYDYAWMPRGATSNTDLLIADTDGPTPTFAVPDALDATTTYEYLLTVSATNAESASAEVTVTVLNRGVLAVVCTDTDSVYEGSEDFALDCSASGVPAGSEYAYAWTARGSTANTALLTAGTDGPTPTFAVPDALDATTTYEYLLTVSATNAESASAEVTVTVLNRGVLAVVCTDPPSVYEGSADITLDCSASGAPVGSEYAYAWTARGSTANTALLTAGTDGPTPTFAVPDALDATTTYEYLLTVSATNAEGAMAEVTVTVLNKGALAVVCADPGSVYEGSADIAFDCSASGAPVGSEYAYAWTARGSTANTALLIADTDGPTPTFAVPDEVDEDETYEYLLTVSADNAEGATAEVTVTVLNKGALAVVCADPGSVYEGSADIAFDCSASGAPGDNPQYAYAWTARGDTPDTSLLNATDISSPVFYVPDEVDEDETYEYLLTVSAANAESASAEVMVTVLDRAVVPPSEPVSPPLTSSSSSTQEPSDPSALGVTVSASSLRFGVQSADTEASLDPMTDQISTYISGPYHAGRMMLSLDGSAEVDENGNMALSIELASPVVLRSEGGIKDALIVLSPQWSFAESCEQLSSQAIGGLYTETTLSEADCRLLYFGGELDLTDAPSGRYAGSMDVILRSGEREETHSVEVDVTVIPVQRVITIGPGGVRFSMSRELPAGLTEEQNLSIYPDVAFLTEEKSHGVFELSNPSLVPLEVTVSARFGYTEATANGHEVVVEETSGSPLGDLSSVVDIYPGVLVLMPGEKGLVRYGVKEGALAAMAEKGYAAFFDVVSEPRQYVRTDQMPEEVTGEKTARVTMRVPGVYVPAEGTSQLRATLLSISFVGSMSATFLLETQDHPFVGEVVAYDGDDKELGRRETLVYTRSRVRVPLDRIPEKGAVFLRFAPRGSGRVPEPASVEWDAPRRNMGEAEKKEKTPTTATVAGRP